MPGISDAQVDNILDISAQAAECASETHFPPALLKQMSELFGSKSCVYYTMSEDLDHHPIWDGFGFNLSASKIKDYETYFRNFDPCFAGLKRRARAGQHLIVSTDQVIAGERSYMSSGYYQDFLLPQRIHNSIIFAAGDHDGLLGLFGFHRSRRRPRYAAAEHLTARLFSAQIAHALRLRKLSSAHARLRGVVRKLMERASIRDYVVVDRHWRVIESAGPASAKLMGPSGGALVIDESGRSDALRLPKELKDYFLSLPLQSVQAGRPEQRPPDAHRIFDNIPGWPRVLVDVLESGAAQPLFLIAFLTRRHDLLSRSRLAEFSITPREREIAREVSRGLTTTQIAHELKISEKTVEQHLDHLYRKTGTHNRTALIYRLSG